MWAWPRCMYDVETKPLAELEMKIESLKLSHDITKTGNSHVRRTLACHPRQPKSEMPRLTLAPCC